MQVEWPTHMQIEPPTLAAFASLRSTLIALHNKQVAKSPSIFSWTPVEWIALHTAESLWNAVCNRVMIAWHMTDLLFEDDEFDEDEFLAGDWLLEDNDGVDVLSRCATAHEVGDSCPICLLPIQSTLEAVGDLACGHVFHAQCISSWAEGHGTCPVCRTTMG